MKVVIGGAFNGKRKFVEDYLLQIHVSEYTIFDGVFPTEKSISSKKYIVITNFEKIILSHFTLGEDEIVQRIMEKLSLLHTQTEIICICNDIGRGVVPIHKDERKLRDTCGRLYQKLFQESDTVIRVWYGIPELLKGKYESGQE
nr:bifunctional adenosylcobinamide kinase/adenosylcobinamide-phosphate guanylyltransferase [Lysinibacillus timonensis]